MPKKQTERHTRIYSLGEDRVNAIVAMLVKGTTAHMVAKHIKEVWKAFPEVGIATLSKQVTRFRDDHARMVLDGGVDKEVDRAVVQIKKALDPILELGELAEVQKARVGRALLRENTMPMIMAGTTHEIVVLAGIYERIGKLMIDVGLLRKLSPGSKKPGEPESQDVYHGQFQISDQLKQATLKALNVIEGKAEHVSTDSVNVDQRQPLSEDIGRGARNR